jgi:hypothetical protein
MYEKMYKDLNKFFFSPLSYFVNSKNLPLHDHHLGNITKKIERKEVQKAPSWGFFFLCFFTIL